ncbi:DNA polymerase domain-containing protein, partial [Halorubrum sp. SP9]
PAEYKYLGAHVETPTAGVNQNVVYIDVSSMYPSFILTLNASLETTIGTRDDLRESEYTEDDCVWGYIDTRPVKHLDKGEPWQQYTDGQYKVVYDPHAPATKWSCDDGAGPRYEKVYFLAHDVQKGFLTECVEELIDLKNQYRGTSLYGSTKRV